MPRNFFKKKSQVRPKKEEKWRKKGKCITLVKEEKKKTQRPIDTKKRKRKKRGINTRCMHGFKNRTEPRTGS